MKSTAIASSVLLFSSLSAASWPWQDSWHNQALEIAGLIRRDNAKRSATETYTAVTLGNTAASSANPTDSFASVAAAATTSDASSSSSSTTADTSDASTTGGSSAAASSGGSSATATTSGSSSSSSKATSSGTTSTNTSGASSQASSATTATSINQEDPAGGVSMISPDPTASSSYYKIGNYVTFAWNYTSLQVTPTAVDILASCSANAYTYTLGLNQSITASTQAFTWDTGAYQETATIPLLTETYTLIIHDAQVAVTAAASAGYLGTYDSLTFGMYTPQPYTPLADFVCATCSGAMSGMERQTLGFLFAMAGIAIASFTIFAGGAGIF